MLFGLPLFERAIQAQIKAIQSSEQPTTQDSVHTGPGEVAVGSSGANQKKH
jgi:hypothetical protein